MTSLRKRRRAGFKPNPYVVFADLAISLFFISTVVGFSNMIASSQALAAAFRTERQIKLCDRVLSGLQTLYPGAEIRKVVGEHYILRKNGDVLAEIWVNASYLRIQVMQSLWTKGKAQYDSESVNEIYKRLALDLVPDAPAFSYIYSHGIVEPSEQLNESDAVAVSRQRADIVLSLLRGTDLIGPMGVPDQKINSSGHPCVPAKNAIAFGTGSTLYFINKPVGRVDLLLFFTDETKSTN